MHNITDTHTHWETEEAETIGPTVPSIGIEIMNMKSGLYICEAHDMFLIDKIW